MHQEGRVISTTNSAGLPGSQLPSTPTVVEHDHRVDRIKVLTFDARKSEQYELILMDLLVTDKSGFLADRRRLNVPLSRARNGLIILCNKTKIMNIGRRARNLTELMRYMRTCTVTLGSGGSISKIPGPNGEISRQPYIEFPKCKYFSPKGKPTIDHIFVQPGQAFNN